MWVSKTGGRGRITHLLLPGKAVDLPGVDVEPKCVDVGPSVSKYPKDF